MGKKKGRPYVASVHSNLKSPLPGGDAWSLELHPKTLLVGSNTSHKSGVIQSVELALAGSADDIVGRNAVADAALLMTLTSTEELGVSARLSDGEAALFNVSRKDGAIKKPQHVGPGESALCYRDIRKALAGSSATARKAFLGWVASGVTKNDVLAHLDTAVHGRYQDIADHVGRDKDAVETLLAITEYAGKKARETSKEIKGAQAIVEEIGANVENRPSDDDVDTVKAAYEQAKTELEAALRADSGTGITEWDKAKKMAEAEASIEQWQKEATSRAKQLELAKAHVPTKPEHFEMASPLLDWAVNNGVDQCPACSSAVGKAHMIQCRDFYEDQVKQWMQANTVSLEAIEKLTADLASDEENLKQWWDEYHRLEEVPVTTDSGASVTSARSRLDAAQLAMTATEVAASKWDQLVSARERLSSLGLDLERYKILKKECESAVGALLDEQTDSFVDRVSGYLPDGWDFSVHLRDGTREVFRMGLLRDDRLHCSLSGAEWATVVTAISMAVSERMRSSSPVVLIPEDRAWDGKTLSSVMRAFSTFDGQVIMASTIRPTGRTPRGWKIVDMDQATEQWLVGDDEPDDEVAELPPPPPKATRKNGKPPKSALEKPKTGIMVTSRSAVLLETMGYTPEDVAVMSKRTAAAIIKEGLAPNKVVIAEDGTYGLVKAGTVLQMPPSPDA